MRHIDTPGYRHEALFYRGDEEFLTGTRATAGHERMLTTLLFTDVVDSTHVGSTHVAAPSHV